MLVLCGVQKLFYSSSVGLETWHTPLHDHCDGIGVVKTFVHGETKKFVCEGG
jgi:hypothetical protein